MPTRKIDDYRIPFKCFLGLHFPQEAGSGVCAKGRFKCESDKCIPYLGKNHLKTSEFRILEETTGLDFS